MTETGTAMHKMPPRAAADATIRPSTDCGVISPVNNTHQILEDNKNRAFQACYSTSSDQVPFTTFKKFKMPIIYHYRSRQW